jgi:hypothetical protein
MPNGLFSSSFGRRHLAGTGASTAPKLIDAMSHDAAILKQEKHITPKKLHALNVLGVLSKYPSGATSWQLRHQHRRNDSLTGFGRRDGR